MNIGEPQLLYYDRNQTAKLDSLAKMGEGRHAAGASNRARDEKLYKVCVEFESLFIKQMLDVMRKNIEKSDFLHGGMAEDIFEDMLYDEYSLQMAKSSGFGIADMVYRQLTPQDFGIIQAKSI